MPERHTGMSSGPRMLWGLAGGWFLACSGWAASGGGERAAAPPATRAAAAPVVASPAEVPKTEPAKEPPAVPALRAQAAPYDLEADIELRRRAASDDLGKRTDVLVVESTFVVAAPGGRGALASAVDVTRRALAAYFNGRFGRRPERAISVYLFPNAAPYEAYCKQHDGAPCISPYGYYTYAERRIIMNVGPGIGTLTHELVHPLVEADFPGAPDWINEGIASLFEHFYFSAPGEIHGAKNWRHPRLVKALRSDAERPYSSVPAIFGLSDRVFRGEREDLNYAAARFLCQWLDQKGLLWPFYQRWRDHHEADPTGSQSFEAVVGKSPAQADAAWAAWVLQL